MYTRKVSIVDTKSISLYTLLLQLIHGAYTAVSVSRCVHLLHMILAAKTQYTSSYMLPRPILVVVVIL